MVIIDRPVAIRQRINAGNDFNGSIPADSPVLTNETYKHAPANTGGRWVLTDARYAFDKHIVYDLISMQLKLGGQANWRLECVDTDDIAVSVITGSTEPSTALITRIPLLVGHTLRLYTTGATQALSATLMFEPHK